MSRDHSVLIPRCFWTKKIEPQLDCVEALNSPVSGFNYVAHFSYTNCNATPVFIPLGTDNYITASGSYSGAPPELFVPNGGKFDIYFDGKKLTWTVKSYHGCYKVTAASEACSTSKSCNNNAIASRSASDNNNIAFLLLIIMQTHFLKKLRLIQIL